MLCAMHLVVILLLFVAWHPSAWAGPLRDGYQATYSVARDGLPLGESRRTVQRQPDGIWRADARTEPTGLVALLFSDVIEEHSSMRFTDQGVRPLRYRYDRHGGYKEKHYGLDFDWQAGRLQLSHTGQDIPLPEATQDPLSFVLEVMRRREQGEDEFVMAIAGRKRVRDYQVTTVAETTRDTVLGRETVVHVRADELGKETYYDLWLLPRHDHLPLRIRQQRGDETTDLRLLNLGSPPPVSPEARQH
jgi:hypothetical protein